MHILYISQYYPPEIGAPAARVSELAERWVELGHRVTVLTAFPNHPTGKIHPDYRGRFRGGFYKETVSGVEVVRCWLLPLPNRKSWERILNYVSFSLSAALRGLFLGRPDVIVATSPQLLVGLSGWFLASIKRVPWVFEVRDIWPDAILASGVSRPGSFLARALTRLSRFLYRKADRVVVVSPAFVGDVERIGGTTTAKIDVIPNGVETERFSPHVSPSLPEGMDASGRFVVSYIGTIGFAHGLGTLLKAAERARREIPNALFLVVGDGADRAAFDDTRKSRGLSNVVSLGSQPRDAIPGILAASDASLVMLRKAAAFEKVIPTKMLEAMASARPVILTVEGEAARILMDAAGGIAVPPEDVDGLLDGIRTLQEDPELRSRYGAGGRSYIEKNLSRWEIARTYLSLLEEIDR